jgi:hypothetical protein
MERAELIDGAIGRGPMARSDHGLVQGIISGELSPLIRKTGPGGWWIVTAVSVAYEPHPCPTHDLAGWRKERLQGNAVPFYWIVSPQDRALTAYRFEDGSYRVIATLSGAIGAPIPPFEEIQLDLGYLLGE